MRLPKLVTLDGIIIEVKPVFLKQSLPIVITDEGIVIEVKRVQLVKAEVLIIVKLVAYVKLTVVKVEDEAEKVAVAIDVTLFAIYTPTKPYPDGTEKDVVAIVVFVVKELVPLE